MDSPRCCAFTQGLQKVDRARSRPGRTAAGLKRRGRNAANVGFPGGPDGEESACDVGDLGLIQGWEDPLEEGMAAHSSILAWRTPWTEEPGGLQSMGSQSRTLTEQSTGPMLAWGRLGFPPAASALGVWGVWWTLLFTVCSLSSLLTSPPSGSSSLFLASSRSLSSLLQFLSFPLYKGCVFSAIPGTSLSFPGKEKLTLSPPGHSGPPH